jgi:hypothetical protein
MSQSSTLGDLDAEIAVLDTRLFTIAEDHPDRVSVLDRQSILYQYKYLKTWEPHHIEEAVRFSRAAIDAMDPEKHDSYDTRAILSHLSSWLIYSFGETGRIEDINDAITLADIALEDLPAHTKDWCDALKNLSVAWSTKATGVPNKDAITEAVEKQQEILLLTNREDRIRSSMLSDLGTSLVARYRRTKDPKDLESAIQYGYQALEEINEETVKGRLYNSLSGDLFTHYQATGISRSLEEALRISSINIANPSEDWLARVRSLCNHGVILHQKSLRYKDAKPGESLEILEQAIKCGKDALYLFENASPLAQKNLRCHLLSMLGAWMGTRLKMTSDLDCGREGIEYLRRSLELMQPSHRERPRSFRNLAHLHELQFQILKSKGSQTQALAELDKAIQYGKEILDAIPEGDPEFGEHCKNLAVMLASKDEELDDPETYRLAKKYLILAAAAENAPPLVRIAAGIQAGLYRWFDKAYLEAHQHLQAAVGILPRLNPQEMSRDDLQLALREISGLASTATAIGLAAGRPGAEVLQSLEAAHGVISSLFMSSKSDISELMERDTKLAQKYEHIRVQLSQVARQQSSSGAYTDTRQLQQTLLKDMAATEAEIRRLTGFERFQESLTEEDFKALACDGPIIAINVARNRSDAIIVTSQDICTVHLPKCDYKTLEEKLTLFGDSGNEARRNAVPRRQNATKENPPEALTWLWTVVVKPVLDATKLTPSRRVWWITTGLGGRAALHAAGNHSTGSTENTQSRVISSYISSFKALRYARERAAQKIPRKKMLLVTMKSNPPPHKDLDTRYEEEVVHDVFGQSVTHLRQPDPDSVLESLPDHSFVHFACHGFSSVNNPAQNGLLLVKSGQPTILSISDLENIDLKAGAIAYLSACSTAEQSDLKLVDEAIHLANSFQALGFQHVIGTLWGADDTAAGEVARRFYQKLRVEAGERGSGIGSDVGLALHEALTEYKETLNGVKDILKWAPFIHIGV